MASIQTILDALEQIAPSRFAFVWDKIGLQVGSRSQEVQTAVVALDRSLAAIEHTVNQQGQLLLTHHPLIFEPLNKVTNESYEGKAIQKLIKSDIGHIAAHTNWDAAKGGINDAMAQRLWLQDIKEFGMSAGEDTFKLVVFVPEEAVEAVVDACSTAGAGEICEYRRCAFQTEGFGTYEASELASPYTGAAGQRSSVKELRIEMVCPAHLVKAVRKALISAHPYEEPAFDFYPLIKGAGQSAGRIGKLPDALPLSEFVGRVENALGTKALAWGNPSTLIRKIAVVGGAAESEWRAAQSAGADILITGEVRQHVALEASESGMTIMAAGHYATEQPGCIELRDQMARLIPDVNWLLYEPEPGLAGRPL